MADAERPRRATAGDQRDARSGGDSDFARVICWYNKSRRGNPPAIFSLTHPLFSLLFQNGTKESVHLISSHFFRPHISHH